MDETINWITPLYAGLLGLASVLAIFDLVSAYWS